MVWQRTHCFKACSTTNPALTASCQVRQPNLILPEQPARAQRQFCRLGNLPPQAHNKKSLIIFSKVNEFFIHCEKKNIKPDISRPTKNYD